MSVQMSVQDDVAEIVAKDAKNRGIEKSESLDRFLRMGISRNNALARYAGADEKPKAKKAEKKADKKPAKKAAKK